MSEAILDSMYQSRGREYSTQQIKPYSYYNEPIDHSNHRLAGNSHVWGDASKEVQAQVIGKMIDCLSRSRAF